MKILVYQPRVSYYTGGGEIYPLQTAKFFARNGHDVTILTSRAKYIKFSDYFSNFVKDNPKVKVDYLDLDENYKDIYEQPAGINWERWDKESLWVARPAYEYLLTHKFDVVSTHCVIDCLAIPFSQKHVLHLHGTPSELNYVCKMVLQKEKNILAVSNHVAEEWKKLGAYSKMRISTNAIDDTVFFPDENIKRDIDLLYVGRLIEIKGIDYILKSIKLLKEKYNISPNLTIIGGGPLEESLKNLSKELGIQEQVSFKGLVKQEELVKSYKRARVAVLPSFAREGIMSTLLEASACKTPAITTKGTSMEEFAQNSKNALLVNPKDEQDLCEKIYTLLTDKKVYNSIRENAYKEILKKYTWTQKAQELAELYAEDIK